MQTGPDLTNAQWRKSSYSGNTGGDCVEVADGFTSVIPVRDSKNPGGHALVFGVEAWTSFVAELGQNRW